MRSTLVLGASLKANRYSHLAVERLVEKGIETMAYGLRPGSILGVEVKTNFDDFHDIHTISLYLNPANQKAYYQTIIDLKPKRVIFNPGTENKEFRDLLRENGIQAEEACTLVLLATGQY
ncbi:MAG: CoA-binding protein [Allomuricauda sp.]|nr:MAG: CoA-binding protein [Allomuricauda sp.]